MTTRVIKIKNLDTINNKIWGARVYQPLEEYTVPFEEFKYLETDTRLLEDIVTIAQISDGTKIYTDKIEAWNYIIGNYTQTVYTLPFASKTLVDGKKLFKRTHGVQQSLSIGSNNIIFTIPYNWVKFTGAELIGGEIGDKVDLYVLDSTTGTYSTIPNYTLNQFAFSVNVRPSTHKEESSYDADLYIGMQIKAVYNSISAKTIGINLFLNEVK